MVLPYGMWKINLNQITAMKKYFSILALGLASFAILSCNKELAPDTDPIDGGETVKVPMTFTAAAEDSKANISGSSFVWNDGDAIAVFDGTSKNQFDIAPGSEGKQTASFSGSAAEVSNYLAVAPYGVVNNYKPAESWIGVKIPGTQTVQLGRCVSSDALVSTAEDSGTGSFYFQNQFAVVKVSLTRSDVVSVQLKGNNSEVICGTSHFIYAGEGAPRMDYSSAEGIQVTLVCKDGDDPAAFPAGDYFMAIWPTAFTAGYRLILTLEDGSKTMLNTSESVTYERNGGANLGAVDNKSTWCPSTIMTAAQLKMWRRLAAAGAYEEGEEVKLGADIDLDGYAWTPVNFIGIFNGQNHKIYNFTISSTAQYVGFIGTLGSSNAEEAVLKDVVFGSSNGTSHDGSSSISITGARSGWTYGGVVGYAQKKTLVSGVTNFMPVTVAASVTGKHGAGGIVGVGDGGSGNGITITGCHNYGAVTDNSTSETTDNSAIGGILGSTDGSYTTVSNCVNHAAIQNNCIGVSRLGGIIGKAWDGNCTIDNCSNEGTITNNAASVTDKASSWDNAVGVGGVLGAFTNKSGGLLVNKCSNSGAICFKTATNGSYRQAFGGVVGLVTYAGTIKGCYNSGKIFDDATCESHIAMGGILGVCNTKNLVVTKADDNTNNVNDGEIFHYKGHTDCDTWIGGIVGLQNAATTPVEYSINNGRLVSDPSGQGTANYYSGGICGSCKGVIRNCTNNGYLFTWAGSLTAWLGGISGGKDAPQEISNCTNNGWISAYNTTGSSVSAGILPILSPNSTAVSYCTNTGMVTTGNFYSGGSGNTPNPTLRTFQSKDYYMGGLFGYVNAPTADVTVAEGCIVACTFGQRKGSESKDSYKGIVCGKCNSTSSTAYKVTFGSAGNPIQVVNTTQFQYGSNDTPAVITQGDIITTTALANKWLMGSSSSLYDATNGSSNTNIVDFNYVIASPAQAGIN